VNVLPALLGESPTGREYLVQYTQMGLHFAMRKGPWKFIPPGKATRDGLGPWKNTPVPAPGMLFHLIDDPGETKNLVAEHPEIASQLRRQLETIRGTR